VDLAAIGGRIRAAREARGLTQAGLANLVGVTRSAVAQWETGRSGQVGANLALIAEILGVGVAHLLLGETGGSEGRDGLAGLVGNERALIQLYRDCTPVDQQVLLRMAHGLARESKSLIKNFDTEN
jgi:transcriptional regulator with XRE-family HTH domain